MTRPDLAIVGGGLLGRCLAWRASLAGARVALYEAGGYHGENSAAWVAAGMIAPATEAIDAEAEITSMGSHSLSHWPQWLTELPVPVFFRDTGTLLLWYPEDAREAVRAQKKDSLVAVPDVYQTGRQFTDQGSGTCAWHTLFRSSLHPQGSPGG